VVALTGDGDVRGADVASTDSAGATMDGFHWESWHDVTVQVPDSWQYGSLSDWCAGGGELAPRIQRPDTVADDIQCDPQSSYGITFQEIPNRDDFEWPVVAQTGKGWPDPNVVGGRGIGGVLITVATREPDLAHQILDSMRPIGPQGDPNGCAARYTPGSTNPPEGALSVCRYDENGELEQSAALFGKQAGDAVRTLQAAPEAGECADTSQGSQPHQIVILEAPGISAKVDLVSGCPRLTVDGDVRELNEAVAGVAVLAAWGGSRQGMALPPELRTE
ncbi:MAG TPA: hypothetical protein PLZ93_11340, partial [Nocardioides sp.]|nr:hypothetical protein [Nocardioides sp.]